MFEHDHEHAASKQITPAQFRELRGKFFTVRHERVKTCGHALDNINEPTFRNCETCWFSFFASHGELVKVTDKALQEHGDAFLDKMRGRTYRKMFCRFMSTMNRLKKDAEALQEKNGQTTEAQSSREVGTDAGRTIQDDGQLSTAGEQGEETCPTHSDEPSII